MFLRIILFVLTVGFLIQPVHAQNVKLNVRAHMGYSHMLEENIGAGLESGFGFSAPFTEHISFAFDVGYWKNEVSQKEGQLFDGSLTVTPFCITLHYHFWTRGRVIPYVFGGVGMVFTSFEKENSVGIPEISIDQELNDGIGVHGGGGSLLRLSPHLALYGELEYLYRKGEGTTTITDMNFGTTTEVFSLSLNSVLLRVGLKYFF